MGLVWWWLLLLRLLLLLLLFPGCGYSVRRQLHPRPIWGWPWLLLLMLLLLSTGTTITHHRVPTSWTGSIRRRINLEVGYGGLHIHVTIS
jgi:hypothetical protein